ncbi:MAG: hypothetical protein IKG21_01080 [Atopobiaceae bacterium]|nr:hypothetical protein [Atopobiaceae bacterium]
MLQQISRRGAILAAFLLAIACVGFATSALAIGDPTYDLEDAVLTKVIDAPADTDTSDDEYVFRFAGGGEVKEGNVEAGQNRDNVYSDGVEQDGATIKVGDIVPTINDVPLNGIPFTDGNTLSNGQTSQAAVQMSIKDMLGSVEFPHAGVYTYVVTEQSASTKLTDGTYINPSQAQYKLRIYVVNTNTEDSSALGDRGLTIDKVTVEQMKDDNGNEKTGKVDPTYPKAQSGKITEVANGVEPGENKLAGDDRGRLVDGFTFANEYIKGGSFVVKKLYDGDHSDRTKYSLVELAVYSAAAANPDAHGACLTYEISNDAIDMTEYNQDSDGERRKLNGVKQNIPQNNHYMATFNDSGWAYVKAELKEDSFIRITGEFGPYNAEYETQNEYGNRRMILSTSGLLTGQTYYVIEEEPGNYVPTGYEYVGTDDTADPRKNADGMRRTQAQTTSMIDPTDPIPDGQPYYTQDTIEAGDLLVQGSATGSATTVFVVNKIDEDNVIPTGIFIDNLPYILMVGVPLVVFAGMFVAKRRGNAAA